MAIYRPVDNDRSRIGVILFLTVILYSSVFAEIVQVQTTTGAPSKPCTFPSYFSARIFGNTHAEFTLILKRNTITLTPREITLMSSNDDDGTTHFETQKIMNRSAAYHSIEFSAAFTLTCKPHQTSGLRGNIMFYAMEGSFFKDGRKFVLAPAESNGNVEIQSRTITMFYVMTETQEFDDVGDHGFIVSESQRTRVNQDPKHRAKTSRRNKRTTTEYYIDVLPVIDYGLYQWWLSSPTRQGTVTSAILTYLGNVFTSISMRLDTLNLQNGVHLKLRMLNPYISQTPSTSPYSENKAEIIDGKAQVNATRLLYDFKDWVSATDNLPGNDHTILFTSYSLYGGTDVGITKGLAFVGTICEPNGDSTSLIQDNGAYQSDRVAAHEIGHSLGSLHDGQENQCSSSDRYVMSNGNNERNALNTGNVWKFSSCSSIYISDKITELEGTDYLDSCLIASNGQEQNIITSKNINDQCKEVYGSQSYVCRGLNFPSLNEICEDVYCNIPGTDRCSTLFTPVGTCCGNGKFCESGQCVTSPQANCVFADESCPFGDQPGVVVGDKTCASMHPANCYNDTIGIKCCETCKQLETGNAGCLYGDKLPGCDASGCGGLLSNGLSYKTFCCGTCKDDCVDESHPQRDGQQYTCSEYLNQYGISECYRTQLHDSGCCETCETKRTDDPNCPFGDNLSAFSCLAIPPLGRPCTDHEADYCCETCPKLATTTPKQTTEIETTPQPMTEPETTQQQMTEPVTNSGDNNAGVTDCQPGSACDSATFLRCLDIISLTLMSALIFIMRRWI